jgi:hypothetical protein
MMSYEYKRRPETDQAFHVLEGILCGISLDGEINRQEARELSEWCDTYRDLAERHPFFEVNAYVRRILADDALDASEIETLKWFVGEVCSDKDYQDSVAANLARLEGILHGILADGAVDDQEIANLGAWLAANGKLAGLYPYDELCSMLAEIAVDGVVTDAERAWLASFMGRFLRHEGDERS